MEYTLLEASYEASRLQWNSITDQLAISEMKIKFSDTSIFS